MERIWAILTVGPSSSRARRRAAGLATPVEPSGQDADNLLRALAGFGSSCSEQLFSNRLILASKSCTSCLLAGLTAAMAAGLHHRFERGRGRKPVPQFPVQLHAPVDCLLAPGGQLLHRIKPFSSDQATPPMPAMMRCANSGYSLSILYQGSMCVFGFPCMQAGVLALQAGFHPSAANSSYIGGEECVR